MARQREHINSEIHQASPPFYADAYIDHKNNSLMFDALFMYLLSIVCC